jgi:2-polyprenyl-6-hydroxyphenyl methylase/3-demethylubiquinone-9 3-methyltransferase
MARTTQKKSSIDAADVQKFEALGAKWWDENGSMKPLHQMNPVRLRYIRDQACALLDCADLSGLKILDVGCGGGILTEPLARQGAKVTGIDAGAANIAAAKTHAKKMELKIDYRATTAEDLAASGAQFDIVTALEIVEHVTDPAEFLKDCARMVKPGGVMFVSTLNRTVTSFALGIVAAEYLLRLLPPGTHDWRKFMKPSEIAAPMEKAGMSVQDIAGLIYNPLSGGFTLSRKRLGVNYMMVFFRK